MKKTILVLFMLCASLLFGDVPRTMYVLNGTARTLSKMDMETGTITNDFVEVGEWPNQVIVHNELVYVVNSGTDNIFVVDPVTDTFSKMIWLEAGSNPYSMAFVSLNKAYVSNLMANTISVVNVDDGTILKDIEVGPAPEGILVFENQVFVAVTGGYPGYAGSGVAIIDAQTDELTGFLPTPLNPQQLTVTPDGRIAVVCTGNYMDRFGHLAIIDRWAGPGYTPAVVDTITVGGAPGDIVCTASGKIFCSEYGLEPNGHLFVYDVFADSVLNDSNAPLTVGFGAMGLLYDGHDDVVYVSNFGDDNVQKYDPATNTVLETLGFGLGAQDMAILEPIQEHDLWADKVVTPAENFTGFGSNFFPNNVLGAPDSDPTLTEYSSSNKPEEILSLGHGGEIVLEFSDNVIINGDGNDFAVYENPFVSLWDGSVYVEAGIVSVSQNGIDWVTFPYDTTDLSGLAGVTPTVWGGDRFDLTTVGLEWASFVKITDMGDIFQEGPYNGDFDLDAIVAINSANEAPTSIDQDYQAPKKMSLAQNYPNPFNPTTFIDFILTSNQHTRLDVYNVNGQLVETLVNSQLNAGHYSFIWNATALSAGTFFYKLTAGEYQQVKKAVLLK